MLIPVLYYRRLIKGILVNSCHSLLNKQTSMTYKNPGIRSFLTKTLTGFTGQSFCFRDKYVHTLHSLQICNSIAHLQGVLSKIFKITRNHSFRRRYVIAPVTACHSKIASRCRDWTKFLSSTFGSAKVGTTSI